MSTSEKVELVESSAAFLARILILMKHSGINLNCMMGSDGDSFVYFVNKVGFAIGIYFNFSQSALYYPLLIKLTFLSMKTFYNILVTESNKQK